MTTKRRCRGEGTIFYVESRNYWMAQCRVGLKDDGTPIRKTLTGKTQKEVADKLIKLKNDLINNKYVKESSYTLINLIELVITDAYNANIIAPATYNRHFDTSRIIKNHSIANKLIQNITIKDYTDFLNSITYYSNSIIAKVYGLLSRTCDKAVLMNILPSSPFKLAGAIPKPKSLKQDKEVRAFTIPEQKALVKELNSKEDMYYDILLVALNTGMRMGEVLALFISDINFSKKRLHIQRTITSDLNHKSIIGTKTKTYAGNRVIPLNEVTYNILQKYKNNKKLLFSYNDEPIRTSTVSSHLRRACANAGIRVKNYRKKKGDKSFILQTSDASSHMLRHTYATRCIESGMPPVVLQRLLGHKDIATTLNTYTDIFHEIKEDEIAKLQKYLDKVI